MIRVSLILVVLLLLARPSAAEALRVRSGEHAGFSRLVITPPDGTGWRLGRAGAGYELRLDREDVTFDTTGIFGLIPKARIAAVTAGSVPGSLAIGLSCNCSATAFETAGGLIVVDVADAAPSAGAASEAPLDAVPPVAAAQPATQGAEGLLADAAPNPTSLRSQPAPADAAAQGYLPLYWRNASTAAKGAAPADVPGPGLNPGPLRTSSVALARPVAEPVGELAMPPPDTADLPLLPDPRVLRAERDLLLQLSRAASQGLIVARVPPPADSPPADPEPQGALTADMDDAHPAGIGQGDADAESLRVTAETGADQATLPAADREALTDNGSACLPDAEIAVASWGLMIPAAVQIADARAALVGEFDRPDPGAAIAFARLYLYLGFGAEAADVLDAFGIAEARAPHLRMLARIMDDPRGGTEAALSGMVGCDSDAAIWAVLAETGPPGPDPVAHGAVLRAFSALPVHLRRHLGPRLADRFLERDAPDVARSVRDAIARAPGDHGASVAVIEAGLDEARGDAEAAEAILTRIGDGPTAYAPAALADAIRSRLARGKGVDPAQAAAAAALGFELGRSPIGRDLRLLAVLAQASGGAVDAALAELTRLAAQEPGPDLDATGARLVAMIAADADDAVVAQAFFAHPAIFDAAAASDPALRRATAERLLGAGLTDQARAVLASGGPPGVAETLLLGRIALAQDQPQAALDILDQPQDPDAARLRGEALSRLGRHAEAAALFAGLGDAARGGAEAWRARDLSDAARTGPEAVRTALLALAETEAPAVPDQPAVTAAEVSGSAAAPPLSPSVMGAVGAAAPAGPPAATPAGPIGRGRALVAESRRTRETLTGLLAALSAPAPDPAVQPPANGNATAPAGAASGTP